MQKATVTLPVFGTSIAAQGGRFAAIVRAPDLNGVQQEPMALIVSDLTHHREMEWGTYGRKIDPCDSRIDGQSNTLTMLNEECPAAKYARSLAIDGHEDYFLPAIGQLNSAAANAPELFDPKGVYWSSTQYGSHNAFAQNFQYGVSLWYGKDHEFLVAPVRVISLQLLITSAL